MEANLEGKTYLVSGATSGIGLATAEILVRRGAGVIGVGRSRERCRAAKARLEGLASQAAHVQYMVGDLSLQSEVARLAAEARNLVSSWDHAWLDGLVNNAGTFAFWLTYTAEGFELQWAVNHLAAFLLTQELLPLLQQAPQARVVTVSSGSHYHTRLKWEDIQLRRHYNGLLAYQQTKLANVLFTLELNRRLRTASTVHAFAADPGLVKTDIGLKGTPALVRWVWQRRRAGGDSPEKAAYGIIYLLTEPALKETGEIYWKACQPQPASRQALDGEAARRLWELSAQMCGMGKAV